MKAWVSVVMLGLALGVGGCSTERTKSVTSLEDVGLSNPEEATARFNVPPAKLVDLVTAVLAEQPYNLRPAKQEGGRILTDWQRLPGQFRIARRWQERTRYLITVAPQFEDPMGKSQLIVMQETQTRATEGQDWKPLIDIDRSERARQLAQDIRKRIELQ